MDIFIPQCGAYLKYLFLSSQNHLFNALPSTIETIILFCNMPQFRQNTAYDSLYQGIIFRHT